MAHTFADCFSDNYPDLHNKFADAARAASASIEQFENPIAAPDGGRLKTLVARLGADSAKKILMLVSGTHGVEGYVGSGCLTAWLHRHFQMPDDLAVVCVNLLNPYGAAYLRRQNEDNVDVNRNFIDHTRVLPKNEAYMALHDALVPSAIDDESVSRLDARLASYREKHGDEKYWQAYGGQYTHADGVFYGGSEPSWSNRLLHELLDRHCGRARQVAFIDIHSGLGPYGYGTLISDHRRGSKEFADARGWFGDSLISLASVDTADGTEAAQDSTQGHTMACVESVLGGRSVTAVTLEFGTYPFEDCIPAMREEAWLHLHPAASERERLRITRRWLRVFYPDSADWLEMTWRRSDQVIRQAVAGLAGSRDKT